MTIEVNLYLFIILNLLLLLDSGFVLWDLWRIKKLNKLIMNYRIVNKSQSKWIITLLKAKYGIKSNLELLEAIVECIRKAQGDEELKTKNL